MEVLGTVAVEGAAQLLRPVGGAWLALTFDGKLIRVQEGVDLNLYYMILYYIILHYIIFYSIILYYIILYI